MSALKPGWADALGHAQAGDTDQHIRFRQKGMKPFTEHRRTEFLVKVKKAVVKAHSSQRLDRVLGPITED